MKQPKINNEQSGIGRWAHYSPSSDEERIISAIRKVIDMPIPLTDRLTAIAELAHRHKNDVGREISTQIEKEFNLG